MWETFGLRSCLLSSMQDAVLIDLANRVAPELPIVFIDNGFHFSSTLETVKRIEKRYRMEIEVVGPGKSISRQIQPGQCCDAKVELLSQALDGRDAWMSGIQRLQTEHRRDTPIIGKDRRGKTKVSPLAQWNEDDRTHYIRKRNVIVNPLLDQGYTSVGCEPCTDRPNGDIRSGRWADSERTECGLHL